MTSIIAVSTPADSIALARGSSISAEWMAILRWGKSRFSFSIGRVVALVLDFVAPVRAARQQKTLQILQQDEIAHLAIEHLGIRRGDHGRQNLRLAMVAVERAGAAAVTEKAGKLFFEQPDSSPDAYSLKVGVENRIGREAGRDSRLAGRDERSVELRSVIGLDASQRLHPIATQGQRVSSYISFV